MAIRKQRVQLRPLLRLRSTSLLLQHLLELTRTKALASLPPPTKRRRMSYGTWTPFCLSWVSLRGGWQLERMTGHKTRRYRTGPLHLPPSFARRRMTADLSDHDHLPAAAGRVRHRGLLDLCPDLIRIENIACTVVCWE